MKKQCKRILFWGYKGLLSVALSSLAVIVFAQNVEVNRGTAYKIASTVDASGASTYQWLENGQVISGASAATYMVPNTKAAGVYRYVRQAKSADCSEWQSSNEFVVSVVGPASTGTLAPYVDPRDGKVYQTVKMPDGKVWFAQNLNYTKDLNYNAASNVANGVQYASTVSGIPAIGSYWCPPTYYLSSAALTPVASGNQSTCDTYGALYTWETAMMVDGKFADETKTSTAWSEAWVSPYYFSTGVPANNNSNRNNARGVVTVNGGGRGICPPGWHIPTDYEWALLLNAVEGNTTYTSQTSTGWWGTNAGARLKSQAVFTASDPGDGSWLTDDNKGTNTTGFGAVPAGCRHGNGAQFYDRGISVLYWSSAVGSSSLVWYRDLYYNYAQVRRSLNYRSYGFSVRCVRA